MARRRLRRDEYTVGWVCALPIELAAAQEMLDEEHNDLDHNEHDENDYLYSLGRIEEHNVAIVCLPAGVIGTNSAAAAAFQMRATFKSIRFFLMVGIGGGVPSAEADIRLGDVVVSQPHQGYGGVVQYDFGKATLSGFQRTGFLNSPPMMLLGAVAKLRANRLRGKTKLQDHISKPGFTLEAAGPDLLFETTYHHKKGPTCRSCSSVKQVHRQPRPDRHPVIHYGTIASGNHVVKNATQRDAISKELGGVLCFEMEAAGLMNSFPCLVIRGICDYADSHKNKTWQPYAAGTASACAKELLSIIRPAEVAKASPMDRLTRSQSGEYSCAGSVNNSDVSSEQVLDSSHRIKVHQMTAPHSSPVLRNKSDDLIQNEANSIKDVLGKRSYSDLLSPEMDGQVEHNDPNVNHKALKIFLRNLLQEMTQQQTDFSGVSQWHVTLSKSQDSQQPHLFSRLSAEEQRVFVTLGGEPIWLDLCQLSDHPPTGFVGTHVTWRDPVIPNLQQFFQAALWKLGRHDIKILFQRVIGVIAEFGSFLQQR
jgi:nucleoside phosphorylase